MGLSPQALLIMYDFVTMAQHPKWAKASLLSRIYDHIQTHRTR